MALNAGLVPVNAQLNLPAKYAQYAQYGRLGLWAKKDKLTVLFAVRELPLPSARTSSASGRLLIGDLMGVALPISNCDQLRMTAMVKTGPRPVLDPSGTRFGTPPLVAVGKLRGSALSPPVSGQQCDYTVDQLVPGFPNLISFAVAKDSAARYRDSSGSPRVYILTVSPQGWSYGRALHPQPSVGNLNLKLAAINASALVLRQQELSRAIQIDDPLTDARIRPNSGALNTLPQSGALINQSNAVSPALSSPRSVGAAGVKSPLNSTPLLSAPASPSTLSGSGSARLNPQPLPPASTVVPNASSGAPR